MKINYEDIYQPHENQLKIHRSRAKYRTVVAGRRFGKSALGINEALVRILKHKKQIAWVVLPTYRQAKEIYWVDPDVVQYFMPLVNAGILKKNDSELSLYCETTQSWIRLKGADNADSLRGSGLDLIIWDEVADVKPYAFDAIEPSLADSPDHRMLYIGTPKGFNHFHDFALKGDHNSVFPTAGKSTLPHEDWMSWHFTSYDNLAWPEGSHEREQFVKFINQQKQDKTPEFYNQEYLAKFTKHAGMAFNQWDRMVHLIEPFDIPSTWKFARGFDYGSTHFTASVRVAIDPDDNWFVDSCYLDGNRTIQEHAEAVKARDYGKFVPAWGDPSGGQWFTEFNKHNLHIQPANKQTGQNKKGWVEYGVEKINERLKKTPGHVVRVPNLDDPLENAPKMFVLNKPEVKPFLEQIEALKWRTTSTGDKLAHLDESDDPTGGHYDLMAALRYLAVSYTPPVDEMVTVSFPDESENLFKEGFY